LLVVPSCSALGGDDGSAAREAADAYLTAWAAGDIEAMAALVADPPADFAQRQQDLRASLAVATAETGEADVEAAGDEATAVVPVDLGLQGLGHWTYDGELELVRVDGEWKVRFTSPSMHPAVGEGQRLTRTRQQGLRAAIVAHGGQPLAVGGPGEQARLDGLAGPLVGSLHEVSGPEAAQLGLDYAAGDLVGADGVEQGFEEDLGGTPSGSIQVVDARGGVIEVLRRFESERPEPLQLTLDYGIQQAAEAAIADQSLPTALVAIDSRTGAVRAVANNPTGYDRALLGQYAPGSTMKIVTAAAALANGQSPDDIVPCPYEIQLGDSATFNNAFGEEFGDIPFIEAFAHSCNTSFVDVGFHLGAARLLEAAETFGFNRVYDLGVPVSSSSFPLPESDTEVGAASIGQGRVAVTPLHMASVAAAARSGTWRPPFLVGDEPQAGAQELPEPAAAELPDLMRRVVTDGTGTAAAILGRDVGGKTGTAEFGDEDPPETHAWFAGFLDDLAFAVVIEGGGVGGDVAAPLIHEFLLNLPPAPAG
jgi:cell division protein FtsI/penicillin-binding protein 2